MKLQPITKSHGFATTQKKVKSIFSPSWQLAENMAEWIEDVEFLKQECTFLKWLVCEAMSISTGPKKENLIQLQQQYSDFQVKMLASFQHKLNDWYKLLQKPKDEKHASASSGKAFEQYQLLKSAFRVLNVEFRQLKSATFANVDNVQRVSIY